ncbi:proteasome lid subunit RPN8/RPN11 [Bradyrhizobium sp. cir1]|uniref:hypothetical protein n=1 Tax=Bradyrhizobium sp. cir1 TaxID=1445730 RepID=UPI001605C456|nr:hypothetical protein [Bradyrhizobium sp. cir1]MBB4374426.1 proteasome lid subunit RPN8/RPN11 [Bradyrhizobium sp. cir1]
MAISLRCAPTLIDETLESLRKAGREGTEGVVLWLAARPLASDTAIQQVFVPEYFARKDVFRIPPSGMTALMSHLRTQKLALAAQVHSHPGRAYHSLADDAWAIVRHEGALSIVVPDFAMHATSHNFLEGSETYCLSSADKWLHVPKREISDYLRITA